MGSDIDSLTANQEAPLKGRLSGLLPIAVFLVLFIGSGVVMQNFYAMPAIVAFLCALVVAFLQNRRAPRRPPAASPWLRGTRR